MAGSPNLFVVLTSARTGSSWLVDLLDSHPRVAAYGELFVPGGVEEDIGTYGSTGFPYFDTYLGTHGAPRSRVGLLRRRIAYVNALRRTRPDLEAIGFKLMYRQASLNPGLLPYLSLRRVRVVHLMRLNLLDATISWEAARARAVFHPLEGDAPARTSVRFDPDELLRRLDQHDFTVTQTRGRILTLRLPYREVFYEELVGPRRDERLADLLGFLGLEPSPEALESPLRRINTTPRSQSIENYDEVRDALAGTRFEWMLGA